MTLHNPPQPVPADSDVSGEGVRRRIPDGAVVDRVEAPDGWLLRRLRWEAPLDHQRGSILFLGGRGDHFEKYLECFADWQRRGWQVESFDWRGQGGSGRIGSDPHVGHVDDFAQWIGDLDHFVADWRSRTAGPHVMIAHSMGGHLLLRALAERRVAPDAAILIAPMLGFTAPYPNRVGLWVARLMKRQGRADRAAWKESEKPGSRGRLRQLLLTHDDGRYADELWWRARDPTLALGPASWQWVEQAYASFVSLGHAGALEHITVPVLALVAAADKLVSGRASRAMVARIAAATVHVYGRESAHEILREVDAVRCDALARIERFLDQIG